MTFGNPTKQLIRASLGALTLALLFIVRYLDTVRIP